jgi:hypothetical protein
MLKPVVRIIAVCHDSGNRPSFAVARSPGN